MTRIAITTLLAMLAGLFACSTTMNEQGTLAELDRMPADIDDIRVDDSLERAAQSYRRYLDETPESARTPEAMRRLADLQIEQAYGVMGSGEFVEMVAPEMEAPETAIPAQSVAGKSASMAREGPMESDEAFEKRATERHKFLAETTEFDAQLPGDESVSVSGGPREAIETYWAILETYPNYERNDQVLYQLSRAYDEIGEPDEAMEVMDRLIVEFPHSRYLDEIHFRRGEYYFVRKKYMDAETAYGSIVSLGSTSSYYELALYKLGWSFYKQELYGAALQNYIAMLDHRMSVGYDFDEQYEQEDEHRLADTFRVISLSFSNLGGPDVVDEYFSQYGHRSYADKIYGNLAEFYFTKLRYEDAASVYKSFIRLNAFHRKSPHFGMRVVEIYDSARFPKMVVEAKKEFARTYAVNAEYWTYVDIESEPDVVGFLKANLTDLASHYHALNQVEELADDRTVNFGEAQQWYRQFLLSFPEDEDSPQINYQLADLLLENEDFGDAAAEYERTAYEYHVHDQASAAGYAAVYAHREHLKVASGARQLEVKRATVESSLRFADTFQDHEQAAPILGAATDDLYEMKDLPLAIESAHKLIDRYPDADIPLIRSAWAVVAHSSIDLTEYQNAEHAYSNVLALTDTDDESRPAVVDGLAAAIYKQGEQASLLEDHRAAAGHFLRIKDLAPTSTIRSSAEYDAATALIRVEDWGQASTVLEEFRSSHPDHELQADATKQLAYIYREDGQIERSAAEHERIAAETNDPELGREALLAAGELYDEAQAMSQAIRVYSQYVDTYPRPLDLAMETRHRLAAIHKSRFGYEQYHEELAAMVAADRDAGAERSDRSRFLAAGAALVLAELSYQDFARLELGQPFEETLAEKQRRMDIVMTAFEDLVAYQVAETTAAATFYIAEIYFEFSEALLKSERPAGLSDAEIVDYDMVIEEEAYPFEEQSIDVHEKNFEMLAGGVYNTWVQKSLDKLASLMPGRYAKSEISGGYLNTIDMFAYRMPIAPPPVIEGQEGVETADNAGLPVRVSADVE